jgi:hypothetical protein
MNSIFAIILGPCLWVIYKYFWKMLTNAYGALIKNIQCSKNFDFLTSALASMTQYF